MRTRWLPLLFTWFLLTLAGCGGRQAAEAPDPSVTSQTERTETTEKTSTETAPAEPPKEPKYLPETSPEPAAPEVRTEADLYALLDGMSREQRVGQMFFIFCTAENMEEQIAVYHPGGVLLFTSDYKDEAGAWLEKDALVKKLKGYQRAAKKNGGIPLFIGSDEEGGTVTRASRNPNLFPSVSRSPRKLYASGGMNAVLSDMAEKSQLLVSLGINVNFAPVCDLSYEPTDFMYNRSLGQSAEITAEYAAAIVKIMRDTGICAVLKHFPGYGSAADTHTGAAADERPLERFYEADFLPFRAGIEAGAPLVLVSHNTVLSMDPEHPASLSPAVHRILREELGFQGIIITDDLRMDAANEGQKSVALQAIRAGNDMLLTGDAEKQMIEVLAALETGELSESQINEACLRVLRAKARLGLL